MFAYILHLFCDNIFLVKLSHLSHIAVSFLLIVCSIFVCILCCFLFYNSLSLNGVGSYRTSYFQEIWVVLGPELLSCITTFFHVTGLGSLFGRVINLWIVGASTSSQKSEVSGSQVALKSKSLVPEKWVQGFLKPLALPTFKCCGMNARNVFLATLHVLASCSTNEWWVCPLRITLPWGSRIFC